MTRQEHSAFDPTLKFHSCLRALSLHSIDRAKKSDIYLEMAYPERYRLILDRTRRHHIMIQLLGAVITAFGVAMAVFKTGLDFENGLMALRKKAQKL